MAEKTAAPAAPTNAPETTPIGPGHTHVRCSAVADRPRAHVSHRVAFHGDDGREVGRSGVLTYCTGPRAAADPNVPGAPRAEFAAERDQDARIPEGAASYRVVEVQASEPALATVDAMSLRVR